MTTAVHHRVYEYFDGQLYRQVWCLHLFQSSIDCHRWEPIEGMLDVLSWHGGGYEGVPVIYSYEGVIRYYDRLEIADLSYVDIPTDYRSCGLAMDKVLDWYLIGNILHYEFVFDSEELASIDFNWQEEGF